MTTSPFSARELVGLLDEAFALAARADAEREPRSDEHDDEPGRRYTEQMVNLVIAQVHPDTAALRRYMVDDDFLSRADGEYWRTGGSYEPPADPV